MVKDISGENASYYDKDLDHFIAFGDTLFLAANDGIHGRELWKSDGTENGTVMVKDMNPGSADGFPDTSSQYDTLMTVIGEHLMFRADDGTHGIELWKSDGTESGTVMVKDIWNGSDTSDIWAMSRGIHQFPALGDTIFFMAKDGIHGAEPWQSDGTESGTFMIRDINPGSANSVPNIWEVLGTNVFFVANLPMYGRELWALDPANITGLGGGSGSGSGSGSSQSEYIHFRMVSLADSDGDGLPDELPGDYDPAEGPTPGLVADDDDDDDGIPDLDELAMGIDPTSPDTDGDGFCDGTEAVSGACEAGPDEFPSDPSAHADADGDGMPDTVTGISTSVPPLIEDTDDDGDGLDDAIETNTGLYVDGSDTGTDPLNPDTDFDGICDGPNAVPPTCQAGPDGSPLGQAAEGTIYGLRNSQMESIKPEGAGEGVTYEVRPNLPAGVRLSAIGGTIYGIPTEVIGRTSFTVWANQTDGTSVEAVFWLEVLEDTDGDGLPDELPDDYDASEGDLVEDEDDDNDGVQDLDEGASGTDPTNPDGDGDGICDGPISFLPTCIAGPDSNPFGMQHPSPLLLVNNSEVVTPIPPPNHVPDATWEVSPDLPLGMVLDPATGMISGTPAHSTANTTYTIWANQSDGMSIEATFWLEVLEDTDGDGLPDELPHYYDALEGDLVEDEDDDNDGSSDLDEVARGTDPRNPDSDGDGVCDGLIAPSNGDCTAQVDASIVEEAGSGFLWMLCCAVLLLLLLLLLPLIRRDSANAVVLVGPEPENTRAEPEFIGGSGTKEDPFILAPAEGVKPGQTVSSKEVITIDSMSMIDMVLADLGQGANGNRFGMREDGSDEGATMELPIEYGEITINMVFDDSKGGPTKEGGEFTGLLKLGRASVYLSWTVRVEPGKKIAGRAAKKGAAVKAAAPKPTTKGEKKAAELERVKQRSNTIDFATLGVAPSAGLVGDVDKGADVLKVSDGAKFADSGSAKISDSEGAIAISWTGRDGDTLTGISGLTRAFAASATVTAVDDLQVIKGIGPFLAEKLNALGITTYRQIANMDARLEDQVNEAIEFFPGRVRRDEWARQAGELARN